jgi:trans-aconitate methyltransferase
MRRVAEPELMLDEEQVQAYAQADFAAPHSNFMELLCKRLDTLSQTGVALDLGCGPGDISRRFAAAFPGWRIDGVDGSAAMLAMARTMTPAEIPVEYIERLLPSSPTGRYDLIFSNSLLHHLSDPAVLWSTIRDWAGQHPCRVFIMDLLRPDTQATAEALVMQYAADEPTVLQHDFLYSLLAAYEAAEISEQIHHAGLALHVEVVSDRHVIAWGNVN